MNGAGDRLRLLMGRQAGWFVAIGCAAAAVHLGIVILLVGSLGVRPLIANVAGWLVAFCASFAGHHRLTFGDRSVPIAPAAGRFFVLSAAGFSMNEMAYAALLRWSTMRYDIALGAVLVAVAVATYWLSRHWAFVRSPARAPWQASGRRSATTRRS